MQNHRKMKTVLITGSSRGIGLELVKQLINLESPPATVIATCRKPKEVEELQSLAKKHKGIHILQLDTTNFSSFDKFVQEVGNILGEEGLNVLINNAGINANEMKFQDVTVEGLLSQYMTNTVGPIMLMKALVPLLKKASMKNSSEPLGITRAAIINVSSSLGSVSFNTTGSYYGYRESKAALNIASRSISYDLKKDGIVVTALHPGWVKTDMGGKDAHLTVETSVSNIVKTIYSISEKHNAGFIRYDGEVLAW